MRKRGNGRQWGKRTAKGQMGGDKTGAAGGTGIVESRADIFRRGRGASAGVQAGKRKNRLQRMGRTGRGFYRCDTGVAGLGGAALRGSHGRHAGPKRRRHTVSGRQICPAGRCVLQELPMEERRRSGKGHHAGEMDGTERGMVHVREPPGNRGAGGRFPVRPHLHFHGPALRGGRACTGKRRNICAI